MTQPEPYYLRRAKLLLEKAGGDKALPDSCSARGHESAESAIRALRRGNFDAAVMHALGAIRWAEAGENETAATAYRKLFQLSRALRDNEELAAVRELWEELR